MKFVTEIERRPMPAFAVTTISLACDLGLSGCHRLDVQPKLLDQLIEIVAGVWAKATLDNDSAFQHRCG